MTYVERINDPMFVLVVRSKLPQFVQTARSDSESRKSRLLVVVLKTDDLVIVVVQLGRVRHLQVRY